MLENSAALSRSFDMRMHRKSLKTHKLPLAICLPCGASESALNRVSVAWILRGKAQ